MEYSSCALNEQYDFWSFAFNNYVGGWDTSNLGTDYDPIFELATAFQEKYECASSTSFSVDPATCKTIRASWIAPSPPPSPPPPPPSPPSPPSPPRTGRIAADAVMSASELQGEASDTYWIEINGTPTQIYCDMVTDGGGWMS